MHFAINHGASRGVPARFDAGATVYRRSASRGTLRLRAAVSAPLRGGLWDRTRGSALVTVGPYARYGYRQGAILVPGSTAKRRRRSLSTTIPRSIPAAAGLVTTACYGFVPADLNETIAAFTRAGSLGAGGDRLFWRLARRARELLYRAIPGQRHHGAAPVLPAGCCDADVDPDSGIARLRLRRGHQLHCRGYRPSPIRCATTIRERSPLRARPACVTARPTPTKRLGAELGSYGGIPNNLRWMVGDAAGELAVVLRRSDLADGAVPPCRGRARSRCRDGPAVRGRRRGRQGADRPLGVGAGPGDRRPRQRPAR